MRFNAGFRKVYGAAKAVQTLVLVAVSIVGISGSVQAGTITFGEGGNTFDMVFRTIGDTGNAADTSVISKFGRAAGSVSYSYDIGEYEVSESMITKYNSIFGTANNLVVTFSSVRGPDKPATNISWNEAARFINWLNTSTGGYAAYRYAELSDMTANITPWTAADLADWNPLNPYRSKRARFVLPSFDEWHKAAYYDPNKGGPGVAGYYTYAQGSDTQPTAVAGGTLFNTAVYDLTTPADITNAGGRNTYGLMAMNGNVKELEETSLDFTNSAGDLARAVRGFGYSVPASVFAANLERESRTNAASTNLQIGFRVAMVTPNLETATIPEPGSMAIFGLGALGFAWRNRRKFMG